MAELRKKRKIAKFGKLKEKHYKIMPTYRDETYPANLPQAEWEYLVSNKMKPFSVTQEDLMNPEKTFSAQEDFNLDSVKQQAKNDADLEAHTQAFLKEAKSGQKANFS